MDRWPNQVKMVRDTQAAIRSGWRRILVTSPTGTGKTVGLCDLICEWAAEGLQTVVYTNRRLLIEQLSRVLDEQFIIHGIRAAGYGRNDWADVQVASLQTEHSRYEETICKRLMKKEGMTEGTARVMAQDRAWDALDAQRAVVDEAHLNSGPTALAILERHVQHGGVYVGLSATPIGLKHAYDHLIVAGTNSEGRACGALVPCRHYGPDEPDLRHIGKIEMGEDLTENQNRKAMGAVNKDGEPDKKITKLFGRVFEWWRRLNPQGLPTILFAPGVRESVWFAQMFEKHGIKAAHIDGQEVYVDGAFERTSREAREQVLAGSRAGEIRVLCNRFVLREGIDAPWLAHGIFATVFGSLQSYLQSGGRLLRASPGLGSVSLQDHGGNWHRHGSLNIDREWKLDYDGRMLSAMRDDALRNKNNEDEPSETEPFLCPQCKMVLRSLRCPCGYIVEAGRKSRPVVMHDGTLIEMRGDIYRPKKKYTEKDGPTKWEQMYWRARKSGTMNFRQAFALFAAENDWSYPDSQWHFMPTKEVDQFRLVCDVPIARLRRKE